MCSSIELDKIGNCLRNGRQKWRGCLFFDDHWIRCDKQKRWAPSCFTRIRLFLLLSVLLHSNGSPPSDFGWRPLKPRVMQFGQFVLNFSYVPFHLEVGHYWLPRIPCNSWPVMPVSALGGLFSDFPDLSNPPSKLSFFSLWHKYVRAYSHN